MQEMKVRAALVSSVLFLFGVIIHSDAQPQSPQNHEPSYLRTLSQSERKNYEDLKADWEEKKADPTAFKKMRARITLQCQMILGRFGYGTMFTSVMDSRTQGALRAYQSKNGIPMSGDVDPLTYYYLTRDDDAADKQATVLPAFYFTYSEVYASAIGAWDRMNTSDESITITTLECFKETGTCIAADAMQLQILGSPGLSAKMTQYRIVKWDQYELVAEDTTPPCERDQLFINHQEKSVTMLSTPTYKQEGCGKMLGKPETLIYHLLDSGALYKQRMEAAGKAKTSLYQFSNEAKTLFKSRD
ncbi:MAG TPA: peptidoglycan-binding domain-containing protein [Nitrososphaera sp.]|nr:peptidoglycan-binding domain-containing protein [Nitrososphaera sp.]